MANIILIDTISPTSYMNKINKKITKGRKTIIDKEFTIPKMNEYNKLIEYNYNLSSTKKTSLDRTLKHFEKYKKCSKGEEFYDWLNKNTTYIEDYYHLCSTYVMFDLQNLDISKYEKQKIMNGPYHKATLYTFLEKFGFVFV